VVQAANNTMERRGLPPITQSLSKATKYRYFDRVELQKGKVQHKTHARIVAESDPRNALSMHALVAAFCRHLMPAMIGNFDATQFVVSQERPDSGYFIRQERAVDGAPLTSESSGGLDFTIKHYHINNAAGFTGIPVFNIADPTMDESAFDVRQIPGLGTSQDQQNYGYLCFTKTRACNEVFYRWFAQNVLVSFVDESRTENECQVSFLNAWSTNL
jgi:hypothetical protein